MLCFLGALVDKFFRLDSKVHDGHQCIWSLCCGELLNKRRTARKAGLSTNAKGNLIYRVLWFTKMSIIVTSTPSLLASVQTMPMANILAANMQDDR